MKDGWLFAAGALAFFLCVPSAVRWVYAFGGLGAVTAVIEFLIAMLATIIICLIHDV